MTVSGNKTSISKKSLSFDISACIVTFQNDPAVVSEAISSFLDTKLKVFLTVVDNMSKTDIASVLQNQYKKNKNVKILHSGKNGGYGFGHNIGLANSPPSKYHLVLNPDVVIHKQSLEKMVKYLNDHPEIGMMAPAVLNSDGSIQHLNRRSPALLDLFYRRFIPVRYHGISFIKNRLDRYLMMDAGYDKITEVPFMSGCFMLLRRSMISDNNLFDDRYFMYFEDADLTRQIAGKAKVVYFPDAVITHHMARFAHKKIKFMFIFVQSAFRYFSKWGWRFF